DARGHFYTVGTINGATIRFMVDTGATAVGIGKSDAVRANVDYLKGQLGVVRTANGEMQVWRVMLNSVRVGDVVLNQVEAMVSEHNQPVAVLGMSFLNRMEMTREGPTMTLKKRY
ncbi:MAG: TIGR02281 family clan AA aspartic protease, partial [Zoogloeaceae bacterium]|nr:TIGR02281 family clan AA aspartic protease [Zoogloeaceae bacterium]